jgi:hypothetical protein
MSQLMHTFLLTGEVNGLGHGIKDHLEKHHGFWNGKIELRRTANGEPSWNADLYCYLALGIVFIVRTQHLRLCLLYPGYQITQANYEVSLWGTIDTYHDTGS